jgi:hypothetical protein
MFSANITNRDPAEILLKNTADREFPLLTYMVLHFCRTQYNHLYYIVAASSQQQQPRPRPGHGTRVRPLRP